MRLAPDRDYQTGRHPMTQTNNLYFIIGALIVVIAGLGAYVWHEESKPKGIEMNIGPNGVSVQEN
jgi:hypothetical protein